MGHMIYTGKHGSIKKNMTYGGENCNGFNKSQSPRCSCINSSAFKGQGGPKLPSSFVHE